MTNLPALAPTVLSAAIVERLKAYAHDARDTLAAETVRALQKASAAFTAWAAMKGINPLPATPANVAANVDELALAKRPPGIRQGVLGHQQDAPRR